MLLAKLLQGVQAWDHGGANRGATDAASIRETERDADDSVVGEHIVLAGANVDEALDAICSVMPLDLFVDAPVHHMVPSEGVELPESGAECHEDGIAAIEKHCPGVRGGNSRPERAVQG